MSQEQLVIREQSKTTVKEPSAFHAELVQQIGHGPGGGGGFPHPGGGGGGGFPHPGGGGGGGFPRPEPPRPQPPRPEPPRPQPPRPEPHPPRPEPPRPEPHPPRPEPPRPEPHPPRPEPPRPEPHPPRPEPPRPEPPRPHPHPEPHPRPHPPHPPDPDHGGFHPGSPFHPPEGGHWGWHDPYRWGRGWDPWFFPQDPNYDQWKEPIRQEAFNIAQKLDMGDAQGAADELAMDLYQMKGDRYAQDELLSEVSNDEIKGIGADIQLNYWDPDRGTWDDIQVVPNDGSPAIPVTAYDYGDAAPWDQLQPGPDDQLPVENLP